MSSQEPIIIRKEDIDNTLNSGAMGTVCSPTIVVTESDVESALVISKEELYMPVTITAPKDNFESHTDCIDIVGTASPGIRLQLSLNGAPIAVVIANHAGEFRFHKVKLSALNNVLTVSQINGSPDLSRHATVSVRVRLPYAGQKDWYTRQELTPDKDIVRCRQPGCGRYVMRETWEQEGCYCGAKGNQFFTPEQPEFFQVKDEVIKI